MALLDPILVLELLLLGCCTGFLAGLLGIGGGMLMVPFLTVIFSSPSGLGAAAALSSSTLIMVHRPLA